MSETFIFLIFLLSANSFCLCNLEFSDNTKYVGDKCVDHKTHQKGICKDVHDCPYIYDQIINGNNIHTICGYNSTNQIVCCQNINELESNNKTNVIEIDERLKSTDYIDLIAPCFINKTGDVGVIKDLRHCPVYLDAIANGETIPRVCDYEICKDFVCCPINPNRLNQLCAYDNPRHDLHYKIHNQFKCTVASAGQVGVFSFKYMCEQETTQKICDYEECNDAVCCLLNENTKLNGFDVNVDFTEIVGEGKCYEKTTNSEGVCRYEKQCLNSRALNYTLCGRDHCANIRCCPEQDLNTLQVSSKSCTNYKRFVYDRVKPFTKLIHPSEKNPICNLVSPSGGTEAKPKEFPSVAALGYQSLPNEILWNCGGTLISDLYILTAGHCLWDPSAGPVKHVRLGALNVFDRFQSCPEDFLVERTIAHPEYTRRKVYNDIALIQLNRKVQLNPFMVPACLPQTDNIPIENDNLIAIGWGLTSAIGTRTEHLLKINLSFYNNSECNNLYKYNINRKFPDGINEKSQICAGSRNSIQDTCPGDSGGPLLIFHSDFYRMHTIIGVTSFGKSCGSIDNPGVYTKVFSYVQWIENIVWPN